MFAAPTSCMPPSHVQVSWLHGAICPAHEETGLLQALQVQEHQAFQTCLQSDSQDPKRTL